MPVGEIRITGRLDKKLTKTERAKLAATTVGKKTLDLLKKKSPIIKARLAKEAPKVKSIVSSLGKAGWELFKHTGQGKRIVKKIKKSKMAKKPVKKTKAKSKKR
jgi:hypothetical protein